MDTAENIEVAPEAPAPVTHLTFDIPDHRVSELDERLAKLAKRAAKLGAADAVGWTWGPEVVKHERIDCPRVRDCVGCAYCGFQGSYTRRLVFRQVTVTTARPRFEGWSFLGTLNHTDVPGGVLRKMVPGVECPAEALAATPGQCDHCRKVRARLETFVVRHEDGRVRVIGRNCIADFLGHQSAAHVAGLLSLLGEVTGACEDEREGGGGGGRVWLEEPVERVVRVTFALCRLEGGYRPRTFERNTLDGVVQLLWGRSAKDEEARRAFFAQSADEDLVKAKAALAWIAEQPASNDFMHNVKLACSAEYVTQRAVSFVVALAAAYDREMVKRRERDAQAPSRHVGEVGKREAFGPGVIHTLFSMDTMYGRSYRVIIRLTSGAYEGAVLSWLTSTWDGEFDKGDAVNVLAATVKKHGEYKGTLQTDVTRVKLAKVAKAAEEG